MKIESNDTVALSRREEGGHAIGNDTRPQGGGDHFAPLLTHWFQTWGTPAFLILADLSLIAANSEGRRILDVHGDIRVSDGRLWLPHPSDMERFRAFLLSVQDAPKVWPLARSDEEGFWVLRIQRMTTPDFPVAFSLLLTSSARQQTRFWADLSVPFLLTPAEDRVARHLFEGHTASELAVEMGITIETARTYIRRIYQKTGASSREKLLSALAPFQMT